MTMHEIEVWVMVDSAGDFVVSKDQGDLGDKWEEEIGGSGTARRVLMLSVKVPIVEYVELKGTAPSEGEAELTVN